MALLSDGTHQNLTLDHHQQEKPPLLLRAGTPEWVHGTVAETPPAFFIQYILRTAWRYFDTAELPA